MENKSIDPMELKPISFTDSLLTVRNVPITYGLTVHIPTVGEVLHNEQEYLAISSSLVASPLSYMIQLDEMGYKLWDKMSDYELFTILFQKYAMQMRLLEPDVNIEIGDETRESLMRTKKVFSLILGDSNIAYFRFIEENVEKTADIPDNTLIPPKGFFYNDKDKTIINEKIYVKMAETIRKINLYEYKKGRPANKSAKKYLFEKEKRKQKRQKNRQFPVYFENLVVAMVNNQGFKYDYEEVNELSLYKFNRSFQQISHNIKFSNTMRGIYAGTVDSSKLTDKSVLSWVLKK